MGTRDTSNCANGMDCFAAQLVAYLKRGIGDLYICDAEAEEEYNYHLYTNKDGTIVRMKKL